MTKRKNILLVSLVAMLSVGAVRAETATTAYVDTQDNKLASRIRTQDTRIATIRDWVNPQDTDGNRVEQLTTTAQDAYRAINELDAAIKAIDIPEQVNADWNATSGVAQILNKPEIPEQVQANWNETNTESKAYIQNKPTNLVTSDVLGSGFDSEHTVAAAISALPTDANLETANEKISALETAVTGDPNDSTDGGLVADVAALETAVQNIPAQVQANWNETNSESKAYIANKPNMADYATTASLADYATADDLDDLADDVATLDTQINGDPSDATDGLAGAVASNEAAIGLLTSGKQDKITNLATIEAGAAAGAAASAALGEGFDSEHTVATALAGKANANDIPAAQVQANWNETNSESMAYIANKPTNLVTTNDLSNYATAESLEDYAKTDDIPAQVQSNWTEADTTSPAYIANKPDVYTKTEVEQKITQAELDGNVTVDTALSTSSTNPVQNKVVTNALPNFDSDVGAVVEVPSEHGAYVLGYVNGKPAYIAVVDANGDSGVDVPWGD